MISSTHAQVVPTAQLQIFCRALNAINVPEATSVLRGRTNPTFAQTVISVQLELRITNIHHARMALTLLPKALVQLHNA